MEKEIARKAKKLKKDEMARITKLVERSMALDPRLKREKERIEKEKKEKARLKKEKLEREESLRKEKEEREARENAEREQKEKEEKAQMKLKREQEKKKIRKSRQALRRLVLSEYEKDALKDNPTWTSLDDMNDDVEVLCAKFSVIELDDMTMKITEAANNKLKMVQDRANDFRDENEKAKKAAQRERENLRLEAKKKEEAARVARASKPWSKEELSALAKAVKKYPAGGANRWETIALFVNNLCKLEDPRKKEECIEKYNKLANSKKSAATSQSSENNSKSGKGSPAEWTEEQDKLLQEGLAKFPSSMDKNERWSSIAKGVPGKTKKDCVARFKAIREALKNK